jgi:hypothetical protein
MPYKAILRIGEYEVGDVVPDDKAKVWLKMYAKPHLELVGEILKPEPEPEEKVVPLEPEVKAEVQPEPDLKVEEPSKPDLDFDLNDDGKEDAKDVSLAAKVTRKLGSKLKRKKSKKKR